MSKLSRKLALVQWIFTIASIYTLATWVNAFGRGGLLRLLIPLVAGLALLWLLLFSQSTAFKAGFSAKSYCRVQLGFLIFHLAGLVFLLSPLQGLSLLPPSYVFAFIAQGEVNASTIYNCTALFLPLFHLIALLSGLPPFVLPMMPAIRAKL